jgi:hypothetical protein
MLELPIVGAQQPLGISLPTEESQYGHLNLPDPWIRRSALPPSIPAARVAASMLPGKGYSWVGRVRWARIAVARNVVPNGPEMDEDEAS